MSYWNHRILKKNYDGEIQYEIVEVFYNNDGSIYGYTKDAVEVAGESIDSLRQTLEWMMASLDAPVLVDGEVGFSCDDEDVDE